MGEAMSNEKYILNGSFESFMNKTNGKMKNIFQFISKIDKDFKEYELRNINKIEKLKELKIIYST